MKNKRLALFLFVFTLFILAAVVYSSEPAKELRETVTPEPSDRPAQKQESGFDIMLLIDSSGSMKKTDPRDYRKESARLFISLLSEEDNVGVISFGDTAKTLIPLTKNSAENRSALFAAANKTKVISNQFRIGLYTFIVHAVQIASLSSDFTVATTAANNLPNYIDNGTNNNGMGAGGTHFENIWNDLNTYFYPAGKGTSSSDTVPFIILVTDGVDNSQTYYPQNSFTGSYPQLPDTTDSVSFCTKAKAAGYTVAVLYIPYPLIVNPQAIWNDEDGAVNYLVSPTTEPAPPNPYTPNVPVGSNVSNNMNSCASPGYFFTAGTSAQVNAAMQQIFYQAVAATRMSQ